MRKIDEVQEELKDPGIGREYPLNLLDEAFGKDWEESAGAIPTDLRGTVEYVLWLNCDPREVEIIHSRYKNEYSYRSIADMEGISGERVRQIIRGVERKLRLRGNAELLLCGIKEKIRQAEQSGVEKGVKMTLNDELKTTVSQIRHIAELLTTLSSENGVNAKSVLSMISGYFDTAANIEVVELGLSSRAFTALCRCGAKTLKDVTNLSVEELSRIRNIGKKSVDEIINAVHSCGFTLKGEISEVSK